jgi:serine/threonine protein kinase
MRDLSNWFEVPFVMPSGRRQRVLLSLEHLLGSDQYLQLRGLGVRLSTATRAAVAERISGALAYLHRHGIVAGDIAPNNLLVGFGAQGPFVSFIDCDSMVLHGRQALAPVETTDWQLPAGFAERRGTRAADSYKLGLVVLRLFARSHDARLPLREIECVPIELRGLLSRSLGADATNRPPAGEWQRALRELLALGGLDARYPGRAPTRVRPRPPAQPRQYRPEPPAQRRSRPAQSSRRPPRRGGHRPLAVAWLVVAVIVLAFMLIRLLAATVPSLSSGGVAGGGQPNAPFQYDTPGGQGFGDDGSP